MERQRARQRPLDSCSVFVTETLPFSFRREPKRAPNHLNIRPVVGTAEHRGRRNEQSCIHLSAHRHGRVALPEPVEPAKPELLHQLQLDDMPQRVQRAGAKLLSELYAGQLTGDLQPEPSRELQRARRDCGGNRHKHRSGRAHRNTAKHGGGIGSHGPMLP